MKVDRALRVKAQGSRHVGMHAWHNVWEPPGAIFHEGHRGYIIWGGQEQCSGEATTRKTNFSILTFSQR